MFERRLKILLVLIFAVGLLLIGRLLGVQVLGHEYWSAQATGQMTRPQITETFRGRILDVKGKPLAVDSACIDACVDYRAIIIPPDDKWVKERAQERLHAKLGPDYASTKRELRAEMLKEQIAQTNRDIVTMWHQLAIHNPDLTSETRPRADAIMDEIRRKIIQSVQMRRQIVGGKNQQRDEKRGKSIWFKLLGGSADSAGDDLGTLEEETSAHVVLPDIDAELRNFLGKRLEEFPGLSLPASTHRRYPLKDVACHVIGRMAPVLPADIAQAKRDKLDEFRQYLPNDLVGREGIESLCEPLLRGARGRIDKRVGDKTIVFSQDFVPGRDVQLTIDAELQAKAQDLLQHVVEHWKDRNTGQTYRITPEGGVSMHGAIVVIDVKTNEVRVLASNPGFDLNEFNARYPAMLAAAEELNSPLPNRATSDTCEPGSTVKPLIGLGAITDGLLGPTETINCRGYVYLPVIDPHGVPQMQRLDGTARCWILSENKEALAEMAREEKARPGSSVVPETAQHHQLDYADAIEQSCDCFFETAADRLTPTGVIRWMGQFGLGRPTGIGIYERGGLRPDLYRGPEPVDRAQYCLAGMGQGKVLASPLQIANEAATIARGGIWMRPHLLNADTQAALDQIHPRPDPVEAVDLHLNPEALRQAQIGMVNVVDGPRATGKIKHDGFTLAAKTGTADTTFLKHKVKDPSGRVVLQPMEPVHIHPRTDEEGEIDEGPNPWYRSGDKTGYGVVHSWYMGYAPVENPQLAFCVLIEYAGSGGGTAAGPVAGQMLQACVEHGYLRGADGGH